MQVFHLDSADFVEYIPAHMTWPKPRTFEITNVPRDDDWWGDVLPKLEHFWNELQHCITLGPAKALRCATTSSKATVKVQDVVVIDDALYD